MWCRDLPARTAERNSVAMVESGLTRVVSSHGRCAGTIDSAHERGGLRSHSRRDGSSGRFRRARAGSGRRGDDGQRRQRVPVRECVLGRCGRTSLVDASAAGGTIPRNSNGARPRSARRIPTAAVGDSRRSTASRIPGGDRPGTARRAARHRLAFASLPPLRAAPRVKTLPTISRRSDAEELRAKVPRADLFAAIDRWMPRPKAASSLLRRSRTSWSRRRRR